MKEDSSSSWPDPAARQTALRRSPAAMWNWTQHVGMVAREGVEVTKGATTAAHWQVLCYVRTARLGIVPRLSAQAAWNWLMRKEDRTDTATEPARRSWPASPTDGSNGG